MPAAGKEVVVSSVRAQVDLLPRLGSARSGRRATVAVLTGWGVPSWAVDDAVLIVSELVTNAVLHVREEAALGLELQLSDTNLRISLSDGSAVRPLAREAARHDENGRGMAIVTALSERWGVEDHHGGKRIWFEVDLQRTAPTAAEQRGDDAWDATDGDLHARRRSDA